MEAVSAVKMRKAQERALGARSYASSALSVLTRISGSADLKKQPLMQAQSGKTAVVVITSDKGLAGSLNSAVIRAVEQELISRGNTPLDTIVFAIGKRGAEYFSNRGYVIGGASKNLGDDASEHDVRAIMEQILEMHHAKEIGTVVVAYTNFVSTFEQKAIVRSLVPITTEVISDMVSGIMPARGKYAGVAVETLKAPVNYSIEPEADVVLSVLLPRLLSIALYHALLENKASEHSARMVAMKSATDKAKEMAKDLTRLFNKIRQAAITREVSEITSGIEAMR